MDRRLRLAIWTPLVLIAAAITTAVLKIFRLDSRASRNRGWPDRRYRWPHRNYR